MEPRKKPQALATPAIPDDVVADILARLPALSICRFRAVCRSWRSLTSDPQFLRAHAAPVPLNHHHHHDDLDGAATYHLAFSPYSRRRSSFYLGSPKDVACRLVGSWDGMLCIGFKRASPPTCGLAGAGIVVVNPVSMACAAVVAPSPAGGEVIAGYAHPDTFAFHLMYSCFRRGNQVFQVIKVGDPHWHEIPSAAVAGMMSGIALGRQGIVSAALHGKLHWQLQSSSYEWAILVFDMVTEEFGSMAAPQRENTWVRGLAVLSSKLCSIVVLDSFMAEIWVLEDYHEEEQSWHLKRRIDMAACTIGFSVQSLWESDVRMFLKVEVTQGIEHEVEKIIIHHGNKISARQNFCRDLRRNRATYNVVSNSWCNTTMRWRVDHV